MLPYTNVCITLHILSAFRVSMKNFMGDSGGIRTHDLLLTCTDFLTSRSPSLPDDDWPSLNPLLYRILSGQSSLIFITIIWDPPYKTINVLGFVVNFKTLSNVTPSNAFEI